MAFFGVKIALFFGNFNIISLNPFGNDDIVGWRYGEINNKG